MKILYDYHMHSEISPDAHFSMEAMCESALKNGMREIAFTDHYEFYVNGVVTVSYTHLFQLLAFIFGNNCHNYLNRFFFITAFSRPGSIAAIKIRNDLISYKIGVGLCYDKGICHNILIMDFVHHNAGSITENNRINSCLPVSYTHLLKQLFYRRQKDLPKR